MKIIYFLCTGNSCRGQMAEGYAHQFLDPDKFEIRSAGIERHGLNPKAIQVMAEDNVDISKQMSDLIDMEYFNSADLIITLCGDAKDKCPRIPKGVEHIHWDLQDPAQVTETEEEIFSKFREIRDIIKTNVKALAQF